MEFKDYFRASLRTSVLTGLALAVIFAVVLLSGVRATGSVNLDVEFGLLDGLWGFVAFPAALVLLTLVASPVVFLLLAVRKLATKGRQNSS